MNVHITVAFFLTAFLVTCPLFIEKTGATTFFPFFYSNSSNLPPVANFTYSPKDAVVTQPVNFFDHSTDPDGIIALWEWDFGDSVTSNATIPEEANKTHVYAAPGLYFVWLITTDDQESSNSVYASVSVRKIRTSLSLDAPSSTMQGSMVIFAATLKDEFEKPLINIEIFFYIIDGQKESLIGSEFTDFLGRASLNYIPQTRGFFQIKTMFSGTTIYTEASSETKNFDVGYDLVPYAVVGSIAILIMSAVFYYLRWRSRKHEKEEIVISEEESS